MTSLLYPTDEKARPELKSSEVLESVVGEHDLAEGSALTMFRPWNMDPHYVPSRNYDLCLCPRIFFSLFLSLTVQDGCMGGA
jgi:hypothetical protein